MKVSLNGGFEKLVIVTIFCLHLESDTRHTTIIYNWTPTGVKWCNWPQISLTFARHYSYWKPLQGQYLKNTAYITYKTNLSD